ncbi:MAG: hypothetical protein ACSHXD_01500 [Marinosulfonomonas sp.]
MIRISTLILALLVPISAVANTTVVRSGEHADFSRLVIQFPDHPKWVFGRDDGGYEFRFDDEQQVLDVSKIFDLIPKTRIQNVVVPGPGRLKLFVDCECHGDAFEMHNGRIVLDIKDGPGSPGSLFEEQILKKSETSLTAEIQPKIEPETSVSQPQFASTPTPSISSSTDTALQFVVGEVIEANLAEDVDLNEVEASTEEVIANTKPEKSEPIKINAMPYFQFRAQPRTADLARTSLLKSLQRAAAQGLVRIPRVKPGEKQDKEVLNSAVESDSQESLESAQANDVNGHIRIETVVDRDDRSLAPSMTTEDEMCDDTFLASIGSWGNPETLQDPYDDLRSRLVGEFDELSKEAVDALVKRQIYLGFGAEANALMAEFSGEIPEARMLREMAILVDGDRLGEGSVLASKITCPGAFSMWGLLAHRRIPDKTTIDTKSVLQAFSALPVHLRKNFARALANHFLDIDDLDTATSIKNLAGRASKLSVPDLELLEAKISDKSGETEKSLSRLNSVYLANGPDAAIALAELIETQIKNEIPVDKQNARAAGALAVEYRGTPVGIRLKMASIRGGAQTDPVETIMGLIETAREVDGLSDLQVAALTSEALLRNAQFSNDETFLRVVFSRTFTKEMSYDAKLATASRLLKLGFAEKARNIAELYDGTPSKDIRLLLAEIAVSKGNFVEAKGILAGLSRADKDILLAKIDEKIGDLSKASTKYAELGNVKDELSTAWRNNDWKRVAEIDDGVMAKAAQLAMERIAVQQEPLPGEQSTKYYVEEKTLNTGRAAREILEELLIKTKSSL